jgi:formate hydrogenlyase transcriptional activator
MGLTKDKDLSSRSELRTRAENQLSEKTAASNSKNTHNSAQKLNQELEIHKIELEMQNDELRLAHEEITLSRDNYLELYDFAPNGYFTLDKGGLIRRVNLTGARLLGIERRLLANKPFTRFIADAKERKLFASHIESVLQNHGMQTCDIRLLSINGAEISGRIQSVAIEAGEGKDRYVFSSLVDNSVCVQLGNELQSAHDKLELTVQERTSQLTQEIDDRKKAEKSLQSAFAEIKVLKDRLEAENTYLHQEVAFHNNFGEIIGQSKVLSHVFQKIEQVAPMAATVLLLGETGTGKGVVARAIHSSSTRKDRPMLTVNCTTIPATLVESELFGREKGAFTGAYDRQIGRFELANGGTIFLDEIGDFPLELQSKLLRVLQDGEFERVGSPRTLQTDMRIIAATNRDLENEVRNGKFRGDLFYRLNVFPITMPPLRNRKEDIPLLVSHFIAKLNKKMGKHIDTVSKETMNALQEYHWPGNVRELESVIERAIIISQGSTLQVMDCFTSFIRPASQERRRGKDRREEKDTIPLGEMEQDHILQVLVKTGWRIEGDKGAARILGLNASTLRARMRKYGILRK